MPITDTWVTSAIVLHNWLSGAQTAGDTILNGAQNRVFYSEARKKSAMKNWILKESVERRNRQCGLGLGV